MLDVHWGREYDTGWVRPGGAGLNGQRTVVPRVVLTSQTVWSYDSSTNMPGRTIPLYERLAGELRREVESKAPDSVLATEERLARRHGVSRATIRLALGLLERAGLVSRHRGRGTIVNPPKIVRHIIPVTPLEQDVRDQGRKLETHVLMYQPSVTPPPEVRRALGLRAGERVGLLWLLREVDDRIVCHDERYLPPRLAGRFDPQLVREHPVSDILQDLARSPITASTWETEISPARPDVADALRVSPGTLVLTNTFVERFEDGRASDAGIMSYRIDRVKFLFAASGSAVALATSRPSARGSAL